MKLLYIFSVIQLLTIVLLLQKVHFLEATLLEKSVPEISGSSGYDSKQPYPPSIDKTKVDNTNQLSLDDIREVVRAELVMSLAQTRSERVDKLALDSPVVKQPDPEKLQQIDGQLETYLSDGILSPSEINKVEMELVTLNYEDRQTALQKLAKAMSKANGNFIQ